MPNRNCKGAKKSHYVMLTGSGSSENQRWLSVRVVRRTVSQNLAWFVHRARGHSPLDRTPSLITVIPRRGFQRIHAYLLPLRFTQIFADVGLMFTFIPDLSENSYAVQTKLEIHVSVWLCDLHSRWGKLWLNHR